jgi:hypothetical protein
MGTEDISFNLNDLEDSSSFHGVAEIHSVSLIYAGLRDSRWTIGPLTGVSRPFLYTSTIIGPALKLPSTIEFLKDPLGGDAPI